MLNCLCHVLITGGRDAGWSRPANGGWHGGVGSGSLSPLSVCTWSFPWCAPVCQNVPLSFLSAVCLSHSRLCLPGLAWCHACMHHGPANKLHRVATLLPLSLSCQVEPLKHFPFSPLHPSLHLLVQPSSSSVSPPSPIPVHLSGLGSEKWSTSSSHPPFFYPSTALPLRHFLLFLAFLPHTSSKIFSDTQIDSLSDVQLSLNYPRIKFRI